MFHKVLFLAAFMPCMLLTNGFIFKSFDTSKEEIVANLTASSKNVSFEQNRVFGKEYYLGRRQYNDYLLSVSGPKSYQFKTPHDVGLTFSYPPPGQGRYARRVTYVLIDIKETSNYGGFDILRGGVGDNYITVRVEGRQTYVFEYTAHIYGI